MFYGRSPAPEVCLPATNRSLKKKTNGWRLLPLSIMNHCSLVNGERDALAAAHANGDAAFYDRVLNELVKCADSDPKLLALMSYVTQNELPVNVNLAKAVIASWQKSPDRNGTSKALHFAALSDDAGIYREAVDHALRLWREGKLQDISPLELRTLFDGEFWILSSGTRSSGAGFVLKQSLADARRELEAAVRANQ